MKTIILDFDGTLADTLHKAHEVLNQLAFWFNYRKTSFEEMRKLQQLPATDVLKALNIAPYKLPLLAFFLQKKISSHMKDITMQEGLLPLLNEWSKNYYLGIITSNNKKNVTQFIKTHNMPNFTFIQTRVNVFNKAKVMEKTIKKQNLQLEDCIYIGDEVRDIEASKQAGIKCIAVSWGYNEKSSLEAAKPDYLVDNVADLATSLEDAFLSSE